MKAVETDDQVRSDARMIESDTTRSCYPIPS